MYFGVCFGAQRGFVFCRAQKGFCFLYGGQEIASVAGKSFSKASACIGLG